MSVFPSPIEVPMTLGELRVMHAMIERLAVERDPFGNERTPVSILARQIDDALDRVWIEFSVGEQHYAMWRNSLAIYEKDGVAGPVADDPIFTPDDA